MLIFVFLLTVSCNVQLIASDSDNSLITQTVYGFLDFTTTIGNTVMVFSPQSSPKLDFKVNDTNIQVNIIETKPLVNNDNDSKNVIQPTKSTLRPELKKQDTEVQTGILKDIGKTSEVVTPVTTEKSDVHYHEYDLLSRQPQEFAEETFRLINHKASNKESEERLRSPGVKKEVHGSHSSSLIVKNSGNNIKNSPPSSHVSSVIGTYISGKYAQILQTASIVNSEKKNKHRSSSIRVLKTAAPSFQTGKPAKASQIRPQSTVKHNRKQSSSTAIVSSNVKENSSTRKTSRHKGKRRNKNSKSSIASSSSSVAIIEPSPRRPYKTKTQLSTVDPGSLSSQYTFKLNRRPGRWQYKTSPKPKVNIRKQVNTTLNSAASFSVEPGLQSIEDAQLQSGILQGKDLDASGSQNGAITNNVNDIQQKNLVQTLNVEISTPENFSNTYYEIATIMSPFIFQAGVVKKTRFITVTSTIEKLITDEPTETYSSDDGPLTENILETTSAYPISLDGSIVTLNPIHISNISQTPDLETIVESFTKTHIKLKTQVLPFVYDNSVTKSVTLVQTYDYTNLITVTKTISPLDENNFISSMNFRDFEGNLDEAGSEINLDLEFGDDDNVEKLNEPSSSKNKTSNNKGQTNGNKDVFIEKENINTPDIQQLALASLINNPAGYSTLAISTRPIVTLETLWESHVVPLVKGTQTLLRTLSKSIGITEKTAYVTETSTVSFPPSTNYPNPFSINPYFNPLVPIPQQPQMITSSEIHHTTATQTHSKILKLTFGARTAYTTIFSTEIVPTVVTKLVTTAIPIQPSGAFPNYFPPPYPPFGYVG